MKIDKNERLFMYVNWIPPKGKNTMETTNRSMQQLAQEAAVDIQGACNLSGLVHSFAKLMPELRSLLEKEPGFSTEKLNQHPIVRVYLDKMCSLARIQDLGNIEIGKAYDFCDKVLKE